MKNVQQAQVLLLRWTEAQQHLWQEWFHLVQQLGLALEAGSQADEHLLQTLRESGHARGQEMRNFDVEKTRKGAGMAIPDCGGQTVMVRNGRVLASGRWPLLLRAMVDRRYLKARR